MTDKTNMPQSADDDLSVLEYVLENVRGAVPVSVYRQSDFVPAEAGDEYEG